MSGHDGFLHAIRAEPGDLTHRLVYADWLDERGDPLGAFIRLQCELEPLRDDYDSEWAEELRRREREMLRAQGKRCLGPLARLSRDWEDGLGFAFRRGLVEDVALPLQTFLDHAEEISRRCPALRRLTLFGVRDRGIDLARCPFLAGVPRLELHDWITEDDARALAGSVHLGRLETLQLWLGGPGDAAICRALAGPRTLPGLRELELVQLLGGLDDADAAEHGERAEALAVAVDGLRGRGLARLLRPFARLFPLRSNPGRGLLAGRLPDGRGLFVAGEWPGCCDLVLFDAAGNFLEAQTRPLTRDLDDAELTAEIRREFGFRPGLIHARAFRTPQDLAVYLWPGHCLDVLERADDPPGWLAGPEEDPREAAGSLLYRWLELGNFVIDWGNDFWAGPDGLIHSS
jgi:uncharacterized protein (TIGR02996 family)